MPYTRAPTVDTYSSHRLTVAPGIDLRPNSAYLNGTATYQDEGMINLMPFKPQEKDEGAQAVTRNPIHAYQVVNSNLVNRGCYVWEKSVGTTYYFTVCGTGVYSSTNGTTWSLVNTLTTSATTPVRFCEHITDTNTKSLVLVDGIEGYVFTSNAAGTKITAANFPSPHVPFPVFIDGYLVLAKAGTGDVYNSDLNHPELWTAGNFLSSELYPDDIQALVKVNNYILVVGTQGCEYFFDAGNFPGTPLARYDGGTLPFGTQIPNSIACNKNLVMFIANNNDGENVLKAIEDFKDKEIQSFVVPALNSRMASATSPTTAAAVRGYFFRHNGRHFYGLAFQGDNTAPNLLNATWAFSVDYAQWMELRIGTSNPLPVYFTTMTSSGKIANYVSGHYNGSPFFGWMEEGAASPFTSNAEDSIQNNIASVPIYTELRTQRQDFGTLNRKFMYRFGVGVSENSSSATTSGSDFTVNVSWTDDDFATFTTPVPLVFANALQYPFITQLGTFRQRSFKITYAGIKYLRYKFLEVDINKGQQ